jgi:hypothetical protein
LSNNDYLDGMQENEELSSRYYTKRKRDRDKEGGRKREREIETKREKLEKT